MGRAPHARVRQARLMALGAKMKHVLSLQIRFFRPLCSLRRPSVEAFSGWFVPGVLSDARGAHAAAGGPVARFRGCCAAKAPGRPA